MSQYFCVFDLMTEAEPSSETSSYFQQERDDWKKSNLCILASPQFFLQVLVLVLSLFLF